MAFPDTLDDIETSQGFDGVLRDQAILALQAKVGINGSTVASSLDYKVAAGDPTGTTWYVDAYDGSDSASGLNWANAFLTMGNALGSVASGDTIRFRGKVTEHLTTPVQVHDVTILGAATRPRHADAQPADPTGRSHGASWQPPASATTPLLKIIQQGWVVANILFDAPAAGPCIQLSTTGGSGDDERSGGHATIVGNRFCNGETGIEDDGGTYHSLVAYNLFDTLTYGYNCISTGSDIPTNNLYKGNEFMNNTNHFTSSQRRSVLKGNTFMKHTTDSIDLQANSGQGEYNAVVGNFLGGTYTNEGGYTAASNDEWMGNYNVAGLTAANPAPA